jgi:hypothetical protein
LVGTLTMLYWQFYVYAAQFESLVGRWKEERFDLLQPDVPSVHLIFVLLSVEQIKDVAKKEVAQLGVSSGSRTAAGSLTFLNSTDT